jgi:hypothetical protein
MFNPNAVTASAFMPSFEMAARPLKVEPIIAPVHTDVEIETVSSPLGASREAASSSCRIYSRASGRNTRRLRQRR